MIGVSFVLDGNHRESLYFFSSDNPCTVICAPFCTWYEAVSLSLVTNHSLTLVSYTHREAI